MNRIKPAIQYVRHVADPRVKYARWMDNDPPDVVALAHSVSLAAAVLDVSNGES